MDLPEELSRLILEKFPQESLGAAAGVCKTWAADVSSRCDGLIWHLRSNPTYSNLLFPDKDYTNPIQLLGLSLKTMIWDTFDLGFLMDFVAKQGKPQGHYGPFGYSNIVAFQGCTGAFLYSSWAGLSAKWMVVLCNLKSKSIRLLPVFETFRKTMIGFALYLDVRRKGVEVAVAMAPLRGICGEGHINIFDSVTDNLHWRRLYLEAGSCSFLNGVLYVMERLETGSAMLKYIERDNKFEAVHMFPEPDRYRILPCGLNAMLLLYVLPFDVFVRKLDRNNVTEVASLELKGGGYACFRLVEGALYAVRLRHGSYQLLKWNGSSWEVVFEELDHVKYTYVLQLFLCGDILKF